jgi:hypothetical protein
MEPVSERIKPKNKPERLMGNKDPLLSRLDEMMGESQALKDTYMDRWAKNLKIMFGIPIESESQKSDIRNRRKTYFRKVWAIKWRFIASVFGSLMADEDTAKIEGRDNLNDFQKAGVLTEMVKYHVDRMRRKHNLSLKHIWAFHDILDNGFCAGLLYWDYDKDGKIDEPGYKLYPPESVLLDFAAETEDEMRYIFFQEWLTMDELKARGYKNLDKIQPEAIPNEQLRQVRYNIHKDPTQYHTPAGGSGSPSAYLRGRYKGAGEAMGDHVDSKVGPEFYHIVKGFYRDGGQIKYVVFQPNMAILEDPVDNPYGDRYPIVFGQCLTVAHRLIGEGFAEPLEGPQESYNYFLNMRKDNIALALSPPALINRYANVELGNIVNTKPGGVVLGDMIGEDAVRWPKIPDVTATSYSDAAADDYMMQEMSGVTQTKEGLSQAEKATVAQLNYMESNEKINLFIFLIAETYWKQFHSQLAYLIQTFETDQKILRIANQTWKVKMNMPELPDVEDVGDFDADIVVKVGPTVAGRQADIQNTMLAIDRGLMYNQQLAAMLQTGVVDPKRAKAINIQALYEDLLPRLGKKSTARYWLELQAPPPQIPAQGGEVPGGPGAEGLMGRASPQIGGREIDMGPEAPGNDLKVPGLPNVEAP